MRAISPSLIIHSMGNTVLVEAQISLDDGSSHFIQGSGRDYKVAKEEFYRKIRKEIGCFVVFNKTIINGKGVF